MIVLFLPIASSKWENRSSLDINRTKIFPNFHAFWVFIIIIKKLHNTNEKWNCVRFVSKALHSSVLHANQFIIAVPSIRKNTGRRTKRTVVHSRSSAQINWVVTWLRHGIYPRKMSSSSNHRWWLDRNGVSATMKRYRRCSRASVASDRHPSTPIDVQGNLYFSFHIFPILSFSQWFF